MMVDDCMPHKSYLIFSLQGAKLYGPSCWGYSQLRKSSTQFKINKCLNQSQHAAQLGMALHVLSIPMPCCQFAHRH